jgi:hypothetical protein
MATTVSDRSETVSLIGSDKVEGTAVYGADKRKIGSVQRVMIDKISGKVAYAVVSFGGFLGMGEDYYPMPFQAGLRHAAWRLSRRHHGESAQGRSEVLSSDRLGLEQPHERRKSVQVL